MLNYHVSVLLELKTFVNERRTNIRLEVGKKIPVIGFK